MLVSVLDQSLTAMPECSTTPRRQRPDYLADFTSGSSADNSCSSTDDEEEEERRKAGGGVRGVEKREKKVSYDLGESKEKNFAERSGKAVQYSSVYLTSVFIRKAMNVDFDRDVVSSNLFFSLR